MDLKFASSPSESTWERPCVPMWTLQDLTENEAAGNSNDTSPRAQALRRAQRELYDLCRGTGPCSDIENFFEAWKDPNHPDQVQPNALLWFEVSELYGKAFENDRVDAARVLLAHRVKPRDPDLWAALKILEETGSKHGLEIILEAGWGIDKPTNSSPTSHTSTLLGRLVDNEDLVDWCLSLGASPNATGPLGVTPMHSAASSGSIRTLETLMAHGGIIEGTDLVAHAASTHKFKNGRIEMIQYLLDNGVPIDAYYMGHSKRWNSGGNSFYLLDGHQNALHMAISYNNKEMVEFLLSRGADRNLEMFSLNTQFKWMRPRELASLLGHEDIVALL